MNNTVELCLFFSGYLNTTRLKILISNACVCEDCTLNHNTNRHGTISQGIVTVETSIVHVFTNTHEHLIKGAKNGLYRVLLERNFCHEDRKNTKKMVK